MTSPSTIQVEKNDGTVSILNLKVSNPDFTAVLTAQNCENWEQLVCDVIAVGSAALRRVQTTVDLDYIESRFGTLSSVFAKSLENFELRAIDTIGKRFSPTERDSYIRPIAELIASAKKDVQASASELEKNARELFDPERRTSAVATIHGLLDSTKAQIQQMFDPDRRNSYSYRLNEELARVFGQNGTTGLLQTTVTECLRPIISELQVLKEKVEIRKAVEQVVAATALKGRPFEEQVEAKLATLAQPFGDDVQAVGNGAGGSRAGDFLAILDGSGKRVVFEARNRKQMSLPAIKTELDREMMERAADFGVYVASSSDMLPQHVGEFQIYDRRIVTTIDSLHIGYRMARVLAASKASTGNLDCGALLGILARIRDAARTLKDMKTKATQIGKCSDSIHECAERSETSLLDLVEQAEQIVASSQSCASSAA